MMNLFIIKVITAVYHILQIPKSVDSSISSFSKYEISPENDTGYILEEFISNFNIAYLEKHIPRQVTIVGGSVEDLQKFQSYFRSYPYIICTEPETCIYRRCFSPGNFVIIFLYDLRKESIIKNHINILSLCKECKVLYIFRGIIIDRKSIGLILKLTLQKTGTIAKFAHLEKNVMTFYDGVITNNCTFGVGLMSIWKPGTTLNITDTWTTGLHDLNGCPVTVSTLHFPPKMMIEEFENGSSIMTGGLEAQLFFAFAKKLNFTIKSTSPPVSDRIIYSQKTTLVYQVLNENSEIAIGRLRPTREIFDEFEFSTPYDHECLTWAVPRIMNWDDNILSMEFSYQVWISVGLIFILIFTIGIVCHHIDSSVKGNKNRKIKLFVNFLDIYAIHLGNPVIKIPVSLRGKFLLMMSLYYTIIMTTAYKTSLASILTTDKGSSLVVDAEGIIRGNFKVVGGGYNLNILKDQVNESETTKKLIERYELDNTYEVFNRIKYDKNFTLISRRSILLYEQYKTALAKERINFDVIKDCVLHHPVVMVFGKRSLLRDPANDFILRLEQSGILKYWDFPGSDHQEIIIRESNAIHLYMSSIKNKYQNIFIFYCICNVFCFLVLLAEIAISNFKCIN